MTDDRIDTEILRPTRVRAILDELGMRPSKSLGQNFLVDVHILETVLQAAECAADDRVLEIGPGLGAVTGGLLQRAGHVVAVEKDRRLSAWLSARFGANPRLTVLCRDALEGGEGALAGLGANKMVSNLPYSVGGRVLVDLAGAENGPTRMVVTVQEEVAGRLTAGPRAPDYGLLSVRVQLRYAAQAVKRVSPTCFWPRPRVGSMVVLLQRVSRPGLSRPVERMFERITKAAFEHRRKQMRGILVHHWPGRRFSAESAGCFLEAMGLDPEVRPEEVGVDQWLELAGALQVPDAGMGDAECGEGPQEVRA